MTLVCAEGGSDWLINNDINIDVPFLHISLHSVRQFGLPTAQRKLALHMAGCAEGQILLNIFKVASNKAAPLKQTADAAL